MRGSHDGRRVRRQSLDTTDRIVAERRRRDVELSMDAGAPARVPWADFERQYLSWVESRTRPGTQKKYRFVCSRFVRFLNKKGIAHVAAVTPAVLAEYIYDRQTDEHPTRRTRIGQGGIRADLIALHGMFSYARECGYVRENPIRIGKLASSRTTTMPFEQDEITRMIAATRTPYLHAVLLTFLYTGLRISDVIGLPKKAVRGGYLTLQTKKRGTTVTLPVHPALNTALLYNMAALNRAQRESPLMFPTDSGRQNLSLDGMLERLFKRAKVEHGHAHRFRDTFSVRLLQQGASLYDVARLLGITVAIAERHYAPYAQELQARGARFVSGLDFHKEEKNQGKEAMDVRPLVC